MRRAVVATVLLCLPFLACAQVNTLPSAPHILVRGHAQGEYVPDRFTIHLDVDVVNKSADFARRAVEKHMSDIFAALKRAGALPKMTRASSLSIQPDFKYKNEEQVFNGTDVSRAVQATFDSLDKLRDFIGQLHTSTEVQISSTDVARSDVGAIRMRLRQRAITNSMQAAAQIAKAYGVKLEGIYSVSEVAPNFAYGIQAGSWNEPGSGGGLESVEVTANALPPGQPVRPPAAPPPPPPREGVAPQLQTGTIKVQMNMYAVYLIGH